MSADDMLSPAQVQALDEWNAFYGSLVATAHRRLDLADALCARDGATWEVVRAYSVASRAFSMLGLSYWRDYCRARVKRALEVL